MANTGYKQATIAYRVDRETGAPVDINGVLTSISGRKQAIAVKAGYPNPNPTLYEIQTTFTTNINGAPTQEYDPTTCPVGGLSPWVLDGGTWHNANFWYGTRIWTY